MYLIDLPLTLPYPKTMITWPICYCYSCLCLYCCYYSLRALKFLHRFLKI